MCLNDRLQPELNDSCGWETLITVAKIFSISDKVVYLGKFSVNTNILQVRMVCRDLENFGRSERVS